MESLYEREVCDALDNVRTKLKTATDVNNGFEQQEQGADGDGLSSSMEALGMALQGMDGDLQRLNQTIKQMEAEVKTSANSASRRALQDRVKQFKRETKTMENDYKLLKEKVDRYKLMGSGTGARDQQLSESDNQRLRDVTDRLEKGTRSLEQSRQTMSHIEDTARTTLEQLNRNTEQIHSIRGKVRDTGTIAGQARGILQRMENRELRNKMIVYGGIAVVAIGLLYLVYEMLFD